MNSLATPPSRLVVLRYRDFRLLWLGELVSTVGSEMQIIAVNWQVSQLLRGTIYSLSFAGYHLSLRADALGLGLLGLVRVFPLILLALLGGMFADRFDRRKVIMGSKVVAAVCAAALAAVTLMGRASIPVLYSLTAVGVAISAFDEPAQNSLVPHLVPRRQLANAVSLYGLVWQVGTIIGPVLAGLTIAQFAIGVVYALNSLSFIVVLVAVWALHYRGQESVTRPTVSWASLVEGLRFAYSTDMIRRIELVDLYATFCSSARTMLPLVADGMLHTGVQGYGVLAMAQPVGAVLAGIVLTLRRDIHRQGLVLLVSVAVFGVATALFGCSTIFILSYVFYGLTGTADTVSYVIRTTIRQELTPDAVRGRMASLHLILGAGGPELGELEAGLVAALCGVPVSIVSGGVVTVLLTAWIAWKWPGLRRYTNTTTASS
jgi:MFS family permease